MSGMSGIDVRGEYNYLTFAQFAVAPCAYHAIVVRPQRRFQPVRISVAPSCARHFTLMRFCVGKDDQLDNASSRGASCEHFPPLPLHRSGQDLEEYSKLLGQKFDVCQMGMDLALTVLNLDRCAPQDFDGIVWGRYLS